MTDTKTPLIEELLVCVSGSVAAFQVPQILHYIFVRRIAAQVTIALSENARRFVSETTLALLSGKPCVVDLYDEVILGRSTHVEIAERCDLVLVVPATANLVSKLCCGIADDTLTSLLAVCEKPIVVVPAMHPVTYRKKATERNLSQLREDGYLILGPVKGNSLSGRKTGEGIGAMPEPEAIVAYIEDLLLREIGGVSKPRVL